MTRVQDKATRDRLRARVTDMLVAGSPDVSFPSPDIDEPLQVDRYVLTYGHRKSAELPELCARRGLRRARHVQHD